MQLSATNLGKDYGLTGQEMNRVLQKLGYLVKGFDGYDITEKALDYAVEKAHHRGTGGYSSYNANWITRTFDDSIKDVLQITPELIEEVKTELASERATRFAAQATARAKANADFLAKQATENIPEFSETITQVLDEEVMAKLKKAGIIGVTVTGTMLLVYGIYKFSPKVKAWWVERKKHDSDVFTDIETIENIT